VNDDSFTKSVISLDTISLKPPDKPPVRRDVKRTLVANNLCFARSGIGIQCLSGDCALNRIADDVLTPFVNIANPPFGIVGGVTSRGGTAAKSDAGRFIAGLGCPDNRVLGNVGDIFQRLDGAPGETLCVKETGKAVLLVGQQNDEVKESMN
jgi:hypothetical protein